MGGGGVKGQSELSTHSHTPGLCLFFAFNLNLCSRRAWNAGVTLRLVRLDDKQRKWEEGGGRVFLIMREVD